MAETNREKNQIQKWYRVKYDENKVYREVNPPEKEPWQDSLKWEEIERICLELNDLYNTDTLYIFVKGKESSYAIPMEAEGGEALWEEIINRELFDEKLAMAAMTEGSGLFCWPPIG